MALKLFLLCFWQAIEAEMKRRAMKGREESIRAFEAKIQRNRVRSATMRSRIDRVKEDFEKYKDQKLQELFKSMDKTSQQHRALVEQRSAALRAKHDLNTGKHSERMRGIMQRQNDYAWQKWEKQLHREQILNDRALMKEAQRKEWLDSARASIYDDFMRKEVLIDTLNCKKIRDDFANMWLESYPIVSMRPTTNAQQ